MSVSVKHQVLFWAHNFFLNDGNKLLIFPDFLCSLVKEKGAVAEREYARVAVLYLLNSSYLWRENLQVLGCNLCFQAAG